MRRSLSASPWRRRRRGSHPCLDRSAPRRFRPRGLRALSSVPSPVPSAAARAHPPLKGAGVKVVGVASAASPRIHKTPPRKPRESIVAPRGRGFLCKRFRSALRTAFSSGRLPHSVSRSTGQIPPAQAPPPSRTPAVSRLKRLSRRLSRGTGHRAGQLRSDYRREGARSGAAAER